jgi:phospholipase C
MVNKGNILKFVMVLILMEACSLTTPRSSSGSSPQPVNPQVNVQSAPTSVPANTPSTPNSSSPADLALARQKIKHIVIIMQENRSFDSYFGTYPGADGIPAQNGKVHRLRERSQNRHSALPRIHDPANRNQGGPHGAVACIGRY